MSSLLARSLLRRAVATSSRRSVWMIAQRLAAAPVATRSMSFAVHRPSSALSELLGREYAEEEKSGALDMPSELTELHSRLSNKWKIVDDKDSGTVKMCKKDGVAKVTVVFHCQDKVEDDVFFEEEDENAGDELATDTHFMVTVTKGAGKTMVLSCTSADSKVNVESVATTTEDAHQVQAKGKVHDKLYQGPQFEELAEDVKGAFHNYVTEECGIDSDVATFISMFADFKEQEEYARWISQVQRIVN